MGSSPTPGTIMKSYSGTVVRRSGKAGSLGFPTINILFTDPEVSGIYAAQVIAGTDTYEAAAYADPKRQTLEAYLLDFSGSLDEVPVTITLLQKIRDDKTFDSTDELQPAIAQDVAQIRTYFKEHALP